MTTRRRFLAFRLGGAHVAALALATAICQAADQPPESPAAQPGDERSNQLEQSPIERGEYIVHHVAMCIYCHTPHDKDGRLQRQRLLQGAAVPVASPFTGQQWAFTAPQIAGLPAGWKEGEVASFLQTGEAPGGSAARLPMPPFRMTEADARAVAAYLKSLQ